MISVDAIRVTLRAMGRGPRICVLRRVGGNCPPYSRNCSGVSLVAAYPNDGPDKRAFLHHVAITCLAHPDRGGLARTAHSTGTEGGNQDTGACEATALMLNHRSIETAGHNRAGGLGGLRGLRAT